MIQSNIILDILYIFHLLFQHAMNPFYEPNTPIKSAAFERKATFYGRKYLTG